MFHNPNRYCLTFSVFASGTNLTDKTNYLAHTDAIVLSTVDFSSASISICVQTLKPPPFKSRRKHLTVVFYFLMDVLLSYVRSYAVYVLVLLDGFIQTIYYYKRVKVIVKFPCKNKQAT